MNPNITREGIEVKTGQVWRDLDPRMKGRKVVVLWVSDGYARVKGARETQLNVKRMHKHSTGWELVSSSDSAPGEPK